MLYAVCSIGVTFYIGGVKHKSDIVVDVKEEEGRMLLQFSAVDDTLKELYKQLSGSEEEGRRDSKETEEAITTRQLLFFCASGFETAKCYASLCRQRKGSFIDVSL